MTRHSFVHGDARNVDFAADQSVHLIVTSPPYPMIAMWDEAFCRMDPGIAEALAPPVKGDSPGRDIPGEAAFQAMHRRLDAAWAECARVLVPGGFLCINIGDATRTLGGRFRLYPNHARIISAVEGLGLTNLPSVVWRKPTNAPTKFMGSGMLPTGAYVTLEHEHILVFRKGGKRLDLEPARRRRSAIFWEERNAWFSDLWQLTGTRQAVSRGTADRPAPPAGGRAPAPVRSAAFPVEVPFRLILMYSAYGDTVLDPFAGTGTTLAVAAALGRRGLAVDSDPAAVDSAAASVPALFEAAAGRAARRLADHKAYVAERGPDAFRHFNEGLGLPVMTSQERELELSAVSRLRHVGGGEFEAG